jgi:phosphoribosylglycinamide formyltransferase-1
VSARIVVLASGRGSNFSAIHQACALGRIPAQVVALLSDRKDAPALEIALRHGVLAEHVTPESLLARVQELSPDWVVLAGYLRILPPEFVQAFRGPGEHTRILNIHPSLLPAFKGKDAYRQAWDAGVFVTGCTVHLVEEDLDSGPIVAQAAFRIDDCESYEQVQARGLKHEHQLYVEALAQLGCWEFSAERRARVRSS